MAVAMSSIRSPVVKISCSSTRCSSAQQALRPSTLPCRHTALAGFAARVGASAAASRRAAVTVLASAVPVPAAAAAAPATELAPPPIIFQRVVEAGVAKAALPTWKMALLGLLAGFYIGFGALLMLNIGVACPGLAATNPGLQKLVMGLFGLPFGLIMVMICGAELFTGNTMFAAAAVYEGRISVGQLARIWSVSFVTNLIGSLGLVAAVYYAGALPPLGTSVGLAAKKVALPFHQAFLRAILANWLVNIAIWQGTGATSVPGKIMGGLLPILTFVGIGLEHSVANMFFIPMAMALGADISAKQFLVGNLLPVTLGNIIGGAVCVAGAYALAFGRAGRTAEA